MAESDIVIADEWKRACVSSLETELLAAHRERERLENLLLEARVRTSSEACSVCVARLVGGSEVGATAGAPAGVRSPAEDVLAAIELLSRAAFRADPHVRAPPEDENLTVYSALDFARGSPVTLDLFRRAGISARVVAAAVRAGILTVEVER